MNITSPEPKRNMMETTLVIAKPCSLSSQIIGGIFNQFESHGLIIQSIRNKRLCISDLERMYPHCKDKPFWQAMVHHYMMEDSVIAIMAGVNAIAVGRHVTEGIRYYHGNPDIRHDNKVHASDSLESFEKECRIFF